MIPCVCLFVVVWPTFLLLLSVGLWLLSGQQLQGEVSQKHGNAHTHTHTHTFTHTLIYKSQIQISCTHTLRHQLLQSHLPSFSFTSACVQPLSSHFCYVSTHTCAHTCVCVSGWFCVFIYGISIVFVYCGACMCLWFIYPPSSPPIPPPPPPPPPPVLSVPAGSKGGVSSASLQRSRSDVDVNAAAVAKHRHVGQTRAAGRLPPGSYSSLGKGPVSRVRRLIKECKRWSAWVSSELVLIKFQTGWREESVKARPYRKGPTLTPFSAWTGLSPLRCSTLFACCLLTSLYMFRCGYPLCACCVDEYCRLCLFVSMFPCWPQHLHGSLLDRCSLTNTHCAPLLSCVSSLSCLTFCIPFHSFVFPLYWWCLFIFSFLFSWVPFPFVSFPLDIHLCQSFPFVCSLLFLPFFLSLSLCY